MSTNEGNLAFISSVLLGFHTWTFFGINFVPGMLGGLLLLIAMYSGWVRAHTGETTTEHDR